MLAIFYINWDKFDINLSAAEDLELKIVDDSRASGVANKDCEGKQ